MKKLILIAALLSGCASTQSAQVGFTQSCAAYNLVLTTAIALRKDGKLSKTQIDQVTLIDGQIAPICTGPLPADVDAATAQITAAVTTITLLEAAK